MTESPLKTSPSGRDLEKGGKWFKILENAKKRGKKEEPKVDVDEIIYHLDLITGKEDKPVLIWQKTEEDDVSLLFDKKSKLLELLNDEEFVKALGNAETYVAVAIVDFEELKEKKGFRYDERVLVLQEEER